MQQKSRAEQILDEILSSERYAHARAFEERVYRDEPILRTGAQAFANGDDKTTASRPLEERVERERPKMPERYRKMRSLARKSTGSGWGYSYTTNGSKLFYEQGKLMEDFEDDFDGDTGFQRYFPTYEEMSDYQLRCYFTWRTRLRRGETPEAPVSFLFVHVYELLCGIGVAPGKEGFEALRSFAEAYAGSSPTFDSHMMRWQHDYAIYHGLDSSLVMSLGGTFPLASVALLKRTQSRLLGAGAQTWPTLSSAGLPEPTELLDALCKLSRYRAERSRFLKGHREEFAEVAARVFARMVAHCHKRRKVDYVEGLFGNPTRTAYTMFPSALFWAPEQHADCEYALSDSESYVCQRGFWWRDLPCRRMDTNREIGNLLHTIDAKMRVAFEDAHPLKERSIPKYQTKFVDEEIEALVRRKEAEEAAQIRIDRSSLTGIRSAAARTREALLTDEERGEQATSPLAPQVSLAPVSLDMTETDVTVVGLSPEQEALLRSLIDGTELPNDNALSLSLLVDAINEAFLDIVGDVVVEYEGDMPRIVEDYVQDVRDALC